MNYPQKRDSIKRRQILSLFIYSSLNKKGIGLLLLMWEYTNEKKSTIVNSKEF